MLRIIIFLILTLALGGSLGWLGLATNLPVGVMGACALIAWAWLARRRWERKRAADGTDPGAPERMAWQRLAGYGAITGHMAFILLNPRVDLHVGSGNWLAIDDWTLILGMVCSAVVFRADRSERDERDERIAARGTRWGYGALTGFLVALLLYMGFAPRPWQTVLSHFYLANLLIGLILASNLVRLAVQLHGYARDREGVA